MLSCQRACLASRAVANYFSFAAFPFPPVRYPRELTLIDRSHSDEPQLTFSPPLRHLPTF